MKNDSKLPSNQIFLTQSKLVSKNINEDEILKIIRALNSHNAHGYGDISIGMIVIRDKLLSRILTGKKHTKIKLQHLRKIQIWTFGSLVHQINSFQEVLKLKQIFKKNKAVTGKTPLFVIGPFCSRHSICLNIDF